MMRELVEVGAVISAEDLGGSGRKGEGPVMEGEG